MIVLKRFAQEADMDNPKKIEYFLVFDRNGIELRLPVLKDTVDTLIEAVYGEEDKPIEKIEESDHPPEATEFGGDEEWVDDEASGRGEQSQWDGSDGEPNPENEDEIPSL